MTALVTLALLALAGWLYVTAFRLGHGCNPTWADFLAFVAMLVGRGVAWAQRDGGPGVES